MNYDTNYSEINVYDISKDWKKLADVDESADWEVDRTSIYESPENKYYLIHASGCSCWEGEATEREFPSLLAIAQYLFSKDGNYILTDKGAANLIAEAYNNFRA